MSAAGLVGRSAAARSYVASARSMLPVELLHEREREQRGVAFRTRRRGAPLELRDQSVDRAVALAIELHEALDGEVGAGLRHRRAEIASDEHVAARPCRRGFFGGWWPRCRVVRLRGAGRRARTRRFLRLRAARRGRLRLLRPPLRIELRGRGHGERERRCRQKAEERFRAHPRLYCPNPWQATEQRAERQTAAVSA